MYKCGFTMCPIVIHNVPYSCKAVACPGQVWSIQDQRLDVFEPTDVVRWKRWNRGNYLGIYSYNNYRYPLVI